jgi:hypothetical protein
VAEVAELAAVSEMVAVKQAGRGGRDENCQQARQRKNRGKANRETPKWTVDLHLFTVRRVVPPPWRNCSRRTRQLPLIMIIAPEICQATPDVVRSRGRGSVLASTSRLDRWCAQADFVAKLGD